MHHHLFGQYRVPKKTEQFFQDVLDDMNISMNFQGSNFSTYSWGRYTQISSYIPRLKWFGSFDLVA